jgi:hypothetical protein
MGGGESFLQEKGGKIKKVVRRIDFQASPIF